jgi:hypothetical protein
MNRVLKRPMFRIGGSTGTGITSGLDKPRQGYKNPTGLVDVLPTREEFLQAKEMFPRYTIPQSAAVNRLLISGGLNLLSRPPQGGLLGTTAAAFKEPTQQFFKDQDTQRATQFATDADLFSTLIEAKGEAAGGTTGKTYAKLSIANDIENTMQQITNLRLKLKKDPENQTLKNQLDQKETRLNYLSKENAVGKSLMQQTDFAENVLKGIVNQLKDETNPDGSLKYPDGKKDPALLQEAYRQYAEFFQSVPEVEEDEVRQSEADGGRAGYQMGGEAITMDQGTAEEPKIDFATLRARLPKEISDDVVRLIAQSPEALEDFATIATQQDVDLFNQKYSVNLVLPQEA